MVGNYLRPGNWPRFGTKRTAAALWQVCCTAQKMLRLGDDGNTVGVVEYIRCGFRSGILSPGRHLALASKRIPALDGLKRLALAKTPPWQKQRPHRAENAMRPN